MEFSAVSLTGWLLGMGMVAIILGLTVLLYTPGTAENHKRQQLAAGVVWAGTFAVIAALAYVGAHIHQFFGPPPPSA